MTFLFKWNFIQSKTKLSICSSTAEIFLYIYFMYPLIICLVRFPLLKMSFPLFCYLQTEIPIIGKLYAFISNSPLIKDSISWHWDPWVLLMLLLARISYITWASDLLICFHFVAQKLYMFSHCQAETWISNYLLNQYFPDARYLMFLLTLKKAPFLSPHMK